MCNMISLHRKSKVCESHRSKLNFAAAEDGLEEILPRGKVATPIYECSRVADFWYTYGQEF